MASANIEMDNWTYTGFFGPSRTWLFKKTASGREKQGQWGPVGYHSRPGQGKATPAS